MKPRLKGKQWGKGLEKPIYELWKRGKLYRFNEKSRKPVYSIDTPPPYVNAPIHIGHATTYVLMDMFARFRRMTGHEVLFPLGLDRNGLPIEVSTEREFKVRMGDVSREKFVGLCKKLLEGYSLESTDSFLKLGIGFNSWEPGKGVGDVYFTDSEEYRKLTQGTFIDLWNRGLVYEDKRVNNYCPHCRTTIADAEIEYKDVETRFIDVKFRVKETGEEIVISTTRPELICTCAIVIYNPKDSRYRHLKGKTAVTPVYGKEVPIKPHPYAKVDVGSGLAMMCSFGDYADVRLFRELGLKHTIAIGVDGKLNSNAGFLEGLSVKAARKKITEELEKQGLVAGERGTVHRTPLCERSKTEIEFIDMPEYYLKQMDMRGDMRKLARRTNFFAPHSRQILLDWIGSLSMDWAISRRRVYATEIPLWYCTGCGEAIVPPKGKYYQPWKEKPSVKKCPKCGHGKFRPEERVFDTWFDSSISPMYIMRYAERPRVFRKLFPCTLRPQGKEIVRTWLYYTLLRCYQLTGKGVFRDVWINHHILDGKGHKMSKSLGNIIDPQEVVKRYGAEPFRLWAAAEGNLARTDFRCSFDRIEGEGKFLTKLWNVARFISMFRGAKKASRPTEAERWILHELDRLVALSRKSYEQYDFYRPVTEVKHFVREAFASHYMELVKNRAYNQEGKFTKAEQEAAVQTLHTVLDTILKLLAPVIPLITYRIYKDLRGKDIHFIEFPKTRKTKKARFSVEELMGLNSRIWKAKKDKGISLKSQVKSATLPEKFKGIEKDLRETHGIEKLKWGKRVAVSL